MLRYLIKTLLQMNLFTDTLRDPSNSSELLFNLSSIPSFNTSLLLDWGNFTSSINGLEDQGAVNLRVPRREARQRGRVRAAC
ncbi:hypothetical protein J4Q44_G00126950 [Coregonus suidteri]|uniref:Uncharacterized protein n=1 Tax=Coregonus suidteri TaxID=861788 RepID=A0AAN8LRN3_9TELE